jgi:hypothetical protein
MTTDYRALCAEILQTLDQYEDGQRVDWDAWRETARAALAQPEPQRPSVMDIIALADEVEEKGLGQVDLVRRALARWGHHTSDHLL